MATKSRVRKKNGKPVKYKPKPKGISKTQMKKILKMIEDQQKAAEDGSKETPEIREGEGELLISPEFIKKLNVNPSDNIEEGPELSEDKKEEGQEIQEDLTEKQTEESNDEGPKSSEI
jgi:hypothetical protein